MLGAKGSQISKYISGQYGDAPIDWITDGPTLDAMKSPVAIAIDGAIYVTLADGKILVMQGGKLVTTITPKTSPVWATRVTFTQAPTCKTSTCSGRLTAAQRSTRQQNAGDPGPSCELGLPLLLRYVSGRREEQGLPVAGTHSI